MITTFGPSSTGLVTTDLGSGWTSTTAVAVESDDSILVAGCLNGHFAVLHYNSDGTQDTSFGASNGIATVDFGGTGRNAFRDGAGLQRLDPCSRHEHADRDRQGFRLGPTQCRWHARHVYGIGGMITTDFGGDDAATALAIQPANGKILVAGYSDQNGSTSFALARYDASDLGGLSIDKSSVRTGR